MRYGNLPLARFLAVAGIFLRKVYAPRRRTLRRARLRVPCDSLRADRVFFDLSALPDARVAHGALSDESRRERRFS